MRYQVPQFIEIEDKIFGPFTLKQFLYIAGGAALCFIIWSILPSFIAVIVIVPVALFFAGLAFWQPNGRPMIEMVESGVKFFLNKKLYLWKKTERKITNEEKSEPERIKTELPKMSESKLRELTWSLDINKNLENVQDVENAKHDFQL